MLSFAICLIAAVSLTQVAQQRAGETPIEPMSPKLAARMTSIINAELLAIGSIPLAATLMARGVGYADWLPWEAGAAPAGLALVGLGYKCARKPFLPTHTPSITHLPVPRPPLLSSACAHNRYVKEALEWSEDD